MISRKKNEMALKCFIAMAFGHDDTDNIYINVVKPLLKSLQIKPFRVDRSDSNDEINIQIVRELKACDFVIADLTYARPSVYYEAGFAERMVPVIYICKQELVGTKEIHFDMLMKNIIPWGGKVNFSKRLKNRICKVTRPILSNRAKLEKHNRGVTEFASLPLVVRIDRMEEIINQEFKKLGFRSSKEYDSLFIRKIAGNRIDIAQVWAGDSFGVKHITIIGYQALRNRLRGIFANQSKVPKEIRLFLVCSSLRNIPANRIALALPDLHLSKCIHGFQTTFERNDSFEICNSKMRLKQGVIWRKINIKINLFILSGILSKSALKDALDSVIRLASI